MYNKRVFSDQTMNKIDGVMRYLFSKKIKYVVSYYKDPAVPSKYKAVVTWND